MRLDERGDHQTALPVQHMASYRMFIMGFNGGDDTILATDLPKTFPIDEANMLNQHLSASCSRIGRGVSRTRMK